MTIEAFIALAQVPQAELDEMPLKQIIDACDALAVQVTSIEAQLKAPKRDDMSQRRYEQWRGLAEYALQAKRAAFRHLSRHIKNRRRREALESAERLTNLSTDDLPAICGALVRLLYKLKDGGTALTETEVQLVYFASDALKKYGIHPKAGETVTVMEATMKNLGRSLKQDRKDGERLKQMLASKRPDLETPPDWKKTLLAIQRSEEMAGE